MSLFAYSPTDSPRIPEPRRPSAYTIWHTQLSERDIHSELGFRSGPEVTPFGLTNRNIIDGLPRVATSSLTVVASRHRDDFVGIIRNNSWSE
jgi:hypothetical protein